MRRNRPHGLGSVGALARPALISAMAFGRERAEPARIDPARFDAWYAEHRAPIRAYLRRVTRDAALADDLFQETWVRFLTHPPGTLDAAAIRAYLFTIATHLARDAWRRETRLGRWILPPRRPSSTDTRDEILEITGAEASASDVQYEAREQVARALRSLSGRERALLWLAHVERYEHREIAAMLDVRPESVRVLLHRARRRALAALRGPGERKGGSR